MSQNFKINVRFSNDAHGKKAADYFGVSELSYFVVLSDGWGDCGTRAYYRPRLASLKAIKHLPPKRQVEVIGLGVLFCMKGLQQGSSVAKAIFTYPDLDRGVTTQNALGRVTSALRKGEEVPEDVGALVPNPLSSANYTMLGVEVAAAVFPETLTSRLPTMPNAGYCSNALMAVSQGDADPEFFVACLTFNHEVLENAIKAICPLLSQYSSYYIEVENSSSW